MASELHEILERLKELDESINRIDRRMESIWLVCSETNAVTGRFHDQVVALRNRVSAIESRMGGNGNAAF